MKESPNGSYLTCKLSFRNSQSTAPDNDNTTTQSNTAVAIMNRDLTTILDVVSHLCTARLREGAYWASSICPLKINTFLGRDEIVT